MKPLLPKSAFYLSFPLNLCYFSKCIPSTPKYCRLTETPKKCSSTLLLSILFHSLSMPWRCFHQTEEHDKFIMWMDVITASLWKCDERWYGVHCGASREAQTRSLSPLIWTQSLCYPGPVCVFVLSSPCWVHHTGNWGMFLWKVSLTDHFDIIGQFPLYFSSPCVRTYVSLMKRNEELEDCVTQSIGFKQVLFIKFLLKVSQLADWAHFQFYYKGSENQPKCLWFMVGFLVFSISAFLYLF